MTAGARKAGLPVRVKPTLVLYKGKANCIAAVAHKTSLERKQKISGAQSLGLN